MLLQKFNSLHLILAFVGIMFPTSNNQAPANSCQIHRPSEYAYHDHFVDRFESPSANCMNYPAGPFSQQLYIHCDGTQLLLSDSNHGKEGYQTNEYYRWGNNSGTNRQQLFIFPTRVSLTTITLHYYTDNFRGLPRLRFYAVPDDFDVWNNPTTSYPCVNVASVPPGGEPAGHRNVSITINFNTKKVLMYKFSSSFVLAVSEVEFFTCAETTIFTLTMAYTSTTSAQTTSEGSTIFTERVTTEKESNSFINPISTTNSFIVDKNTVPQNSTSGTIAIGVSMTVLLILSTILIIIVVVLIWSYERRSAKQNLYSSYSTLSRGSGQQIQSQSVQQDSAGLYDQIHLSPSTGQTEFIHKPESANINNPSTTLQNSHPTYSIADDNREEHSMALNAANQATTSQQLSHKTRENTCEQPTYAVVDKSRKKKFMKEEDSKYTAAEKGPPVSPYNNEVPSASMQEMKEKAEEQEINPLHTFEELYTTVKKKPKRSEPNDKEETPPIPPHTIEELYTAVMKKPKESAEDKEKAPPIPPYIVEEN